VNDSTLLSRTSYGDQVPALVDASRSYQPLWKHTTFGHGAERDLIDLLFAAGIPFRQASLYEDERLGVDIWVRACINNGTKSTSVEVPVDLTVACREDIVQGKLRKCECDGSAVVSICIPYSLVRRQDVDRVHSEFVVQLQHRMARIRRADQLAKPVPLN